MPCSSTPIANCPKTPSTPRWSSSLYNSKPSHPSPLAPSSSPDHISPIHQRQSRRRQQFKNPSSTPTYNPRSDPTFSQVRRRLFAPPPTTSTARNTSNTNPFIHSPGSDDSPQKAFLRARFREKCFQRAKRAREKGVNAKRWGSELSSDGIDSEDVEMDGNNPDEGDDEFGLDDEVIFSPKKIFPLAHTKRTSFSYTRIDFPSRSDKRKQTSRLRLPSLLRTRRRLLHRPRYVRHSRSRRGTSQSVYLS